MSTGLATRFARRSRAERRLLMATAALFLTAHALLRVTALSSVRVRLQRSARLLRARAAQPQQLQWCVQAVARALPGTHSCLIQALCCAALADNSGIDAQFKIGAARAAGTPQHRFHAWVEHQGRVIVGDDIDGFVALA